jgi:hypothetical protein
LQSVERQSFDCCSVITLPSMPQGASVDEVNIAPASVIAILPAREYGGQRTGTVADGFARGMERWERPPRSGGDLRAQLMVFLI